ncbi:MAG: helix-turn-helix domain-containing protein [Nanoarchaeota archaeon]|nr:hypothetical protein [Nanoarchaeota archaeon]MBU4300135.1 hypothetical protein [Nanoarchaeota archaeon]MBU4451581.1 hypothetical protein [Nanoarchaeota archaeon]MCG2724341.1 helix-turn-helix domain-containing protein [archaeon]
MVFLVTEKNDKYYIKSARIITGAEGIKSIANATARKILFGLAERPSYPAELAKRLRIHEQLVYYHIRRMEREKIVEVKSKSERGGALAKYYAPTESAFAIELPYGEESLAEIPFRKENPKLKQFLYPFINAGALNSYVVVGAPDPHGLHQVRSRDGHYGIDLALLLGQYSSIPSEFVTKLDVDVRAENKYNQNMILVGGVLTNVITAEVNKYLPVRFDTENFPFRKIISEKTGKSYIEDTCGIIAKIASPFEREKSIMVIAGIRFAGTKAAVLGLTRHFEAIFEKYSGEDNWGCVVQGLDLDGDGKVDSVRVLE